MTSIISVIICTHNPRRDYLDKVLQALKAQTLSTELWELLLIDNASDQIIAAEIDLMWHPQARHIREEQLGLTPARIRGIQESVGETLIFVDDDNVLELDYLEVALEISKEYPIIGAWGGQIRPEFEVEPPDWTKPYWGMLALREFDRDRWSNLPNQYATIPCGAGLCVRQLVAEKYVQVVHNEPKRASLDRKGKLLSSCGDSDLALTACDMGLGMGQFVLLKLTHLIPSYRLQENYLLQLTKNLKYSGTILEFLRGRSPSQQCLSQRLFQYYTRWRMEPRTRRFFDALEAGRILALQEITSWSREL